MKLKHLLQKIIPTQNVDIKIYESLKEEPHSIYTGNLLNMPYSIWNEYRNDKIMNIRNGEIKIWDNKDEPIKTKPGIIIEIKDSPKDKK